MNTKYLTMPAKLKHFGESGTDRILREISQSVSIFKKKGEKQKQISVYLEHNTSYEELRELCLKFNCGLEKIEAAIYDYVA